MDVVISCIGVVAINRAGGSILAIEGVLGKRAALVLNTAAILCTGVIIASPRTAATTYEMSIAPLLGDWIGLLPFSLLFFAVVLLFTLRPTRIVDIVGKVLTPVLVAGIVIMVVAPESATVVADGISAGCQTMDILAVVGFAIIVQESVRAAGYADPKSQLSVTARASLVACVLLTLVYGGLIYLGATAATVVLHDVNNATLITEQLMGRGGLIVLAVCTPIMSMAVIGLLPSRSPIWLYKT